MTTRVVIPSHAPSRAHKSSTFSHGASVAASLVAVKRIDRGFSLLEVLVATTIITVALSSLAQLLLIATRANAGARTTTYAVVIAQDKMEQLRATDLTELAASPAGALGANTVGYVEYLDANGRPLGGGSATPAAGTVFTRRWSIDPLAGNPDGTVVIQVLVTRAMARGEARLVSVKTRKAG
jgi:prepilin-type N-terminal cleavage/methylation domain-containing protein